MYKNFEAREIVGKWVLKLIYLQELYCPLFVVWQATRISCNCVVKVYHAAVPVSFNFQVDEVSVLRPISRNWT